MKQLAAALLAASLLLCPAGAVSSAPQAEASAAVTDGEGDRDPSL